MPARWKQNWFTKKKTKKIIGTFCNFAPEELIYASGSLPIRLCAGWDDTIHLAEEVLPRDICPLVKSSFGVKLAGLSYFDLCDAVILPASCDAKKKLGEYLADYLPVWVLNLPPIKDYNRVKQIWLNEIKNLINNLEEFTGREITRKQLKINLQLLQKRSKLFRQILALRGKNPSVISHRDLSMVIQASFYDDIDRWIQKTEELFAELQLKSVSPAQSDGYKILITGAPIIWPNYKIFNLVEELGATVLADDLCSGTQRLYDYPEPDEWTFAGILEAIASKYVLPSTCPCFASSYDRIDKILNSIKELPIDGVIYHNLRLCQLFDMERDLVTKVLKEKNIPVIAIHTDYSQEDVGQIKTRIEAFLEMLGAKT